MSAELLRRAAKVLHEHAEEATPGPWEHVDFANPTGQPLTSGGERSTFMGCGSVASMSERTPGVDVAGPNGDLYPRGGYSPFEDMRYIALMHPPVGYALAVWLDAAATVVEANDAYDGFDLDAVDETYRAAITVARAILREAP